jgi:hypothetical protein
MYFLGKRIATEFRTEFKILVTKVTKEFNTHNNKVVYTHT